MAPSVTVVICTWNRATLLEQTLESLAGMRWPDSRAEVLVVNNGSTDRTPEVIETFRHRLPLRSVVENTPGKSRALNRALAEVTTTHVVFTDDDVLVAAEWLVAFVEAAGRYPGAAAFGGPIHPWFPQDPDPELMAAFPVLTWGFCGLDHKLPEGVLAAPRVVYGANMALRLEALGSLRFDERMGPRGSQMRTGEESALLDRLRERGGEAVWVPGMRVRHYVSPSRMTVPVLADYYRGHGRGIVRRFGVPEGPRVGGTPRWVLRRILEHGAGLWLNRLAGRRQASWVSLREFQFHMGLMEECRVLARETEAPPHSARG